MHRHVIGLVCLVEKWFFFIAPKQLNAQERSALARHAARSRWRPREGQEGRERAQEVTYLITQALKNGKQLLLI